MPTLRQITCAIELGPGNIRLEEYGHKVTDGAVETYIVAPETPEIPFHVRVTSDGYIAPGLAVYVFMDGEYQCNRNRLRLQFPEDGVSTDEYQIDFKLRQKEEKTSAGTFIARDWYFTPLNTGNADKVSNSRDFKDNVGTIEVVVLRCKDGGGEEISTDPAQTTVSMNPSPAVRTPSRREPSKREPSACGPPKRGDSGESKQYSMPGSFMYGMGIFDGAGDDPGYYKQYRPRNLVGQEPLPGHKWDPSSGQYRYFNDQDPFVNLHDQDGKFGNTYPAERYRPQTYTVGGDFSYQESEPPQESRLGGPKSFVPQTSPGYDFTTRRPKPRPRPNVSEQSTESSYDFTRGRRHELERKHREQATEKKHREQEAEKKHAEQKAEKAYQDEIAEKKYLERTAEEKHLEEEAEKKYWANEETKKRWEGRTQPSRRTSPRYRYPPIPEVSVERLQPGSGFSFVEEKGQQMVERVNHFSSELKKYDALKGDAKKYHDNSKIHAEMIKAIKSKHEEIVKIMDELNQSYEMMKELMSSMDRQTWRQAFDYLFEVGLYPPPSLTVDGPEEDVGGEAKLPPSDGWEQQGDGTTGDKPQGAPSVGVWSQVGVPAPVKSNGSKSNKGYQQGSTHSQSEKPWTADVDRYAAADQNHNDDGWGDVAEEVKEKPRGSHHSRAHLTGNDGAASESCSLVDPQPKPVIKPYWSEWTKKPVMAKPKFQPRQVYEYPASPMPVVPSSTKDKGITQAVHAGPGANYAHKLHRPEYLDTMAKPYAIFTFKYRSKTALEDILKHPIDDSYIDEAKAEAKKHRLLNMPKDELVEELLKKTVIAAQSKAPSKAATSRNNDWGAAERRPSTSAKRPSAHKTTPQRTRTRAKEPWDAQTAVKPSDSVSQHGASGWGGGVTSKAGDSKAEWKAAGWGGEKQESKKGKSRVTHQHWEGDGLEETKPGGGGFAGW